MNKWYLQLDKPRAECAVVGVYGHPKAAYFTYLGLYALQHRGQESSGIVSNENGTFYKHVDLGLVADVFSNIQNLERLKGDCAVGHNRYSTTGSTQPINAQPLVVSSKHGPMAISLIPMNCEPAWKMTARFFKPRRIRRSFCTSSPDQKRRR